MAKQNKKAISVLEVHLAKILRETVYLSETEFNEKMPKVAEEIDRLSEFYGAKRVAVHLNQALEHPFEFMFKYHPEPVIRKSMAFIHSRDFPKLVPIRIQDIIAETQNNKLISKTLGGGMDAFFSLCKRFVRIQQRPWRKPKISGKIPSHTGPKRL